MKNQLYIHKLVSRSGGQIILIGQRIMNLIMND